MSGCSCIGKHVWDDRVGYDVWMISIFDPECTDWKHRVAQ